MALKSGMLNLGKGKQAGADSTTNSEPKKTDTKKSNLTTGMFNTGETETPVDEYTVMIDYKDIIPNPKNQEEISDIDELAESIISTGGILHNVLVLPKKNGKYMLLGGERRWTAVKMIVEEQGREEFRKIPCHIKSMDSVGSDVADMPDDWKERFLIETSNIEQRRDKNDGIVLQRILRMEELLKEQRAYYKKNNLPYEKGKIRDKIAERMNISPSSVQKYLQVNKNATEEVKQAMNAGELSSATAVEIAKIPEEEQNKVLDLAREKAEKRLNEIANESNEEAENIENTPVEISMSEIQESIVESGKSKNEDESKDSAITKEEKAEKEKKIHSATKVVTEEDLHTNGDISIVSRLEELRVLYEQVEGKELESTTYSYFKKNTKNLYDCSIKLIQILK